jgi:arylsulfatase A-like enzyme
MWTFEPHVAEQVLRAMLKEHQVPVVFGERLDRGQGMGVKREGGRLTAVVMESARTFAGRMFIDATYEGDLLAAAGVSYTVGREPNRQYGETLNGVQKARNTHNHRFLVQVDPYVKPGDRASGLVFGIEPGPYPADGDGDHRLQAYCYRLCMSHVPANRVPFPKPADYDEAKYELLFRNFEAGDLRFPMKPDLMPNGKTDTNNNCAVSTDYIGRNYKYPEASYAERERILKEHESYQKGLMWALANHPRVPRKIRDEMNRWGLAADEFTDNGHWPHQVYVREARRMVGEYVMTELDCRRKRATPQSVGMGSYNMDSHNCMRYVTPEGFVQNEGDVQVSPGGPYQISYLSIVPKKGECPNLLVPVCVSSSHIAYGSIRMEPVFFILGQSAATAAALALDDGVDVQQVPYEKLRQRLLKDKQVLEYVSPKGAGAIHAKSLAGIVLDDDAAERQGFEGQSSSVSPYVNDGYRHDGNRDRGRQWARYTPDLPRAGRYEVRLSYSPNPNRATNVPVTIVHADGKTTVHVNQRKPPTLEQAFVSLGTFRFEKGKAGRVEIGNRDVDGYVIADAVQWVPVGSSEPGNTAAAEPLPNFIVLNIDDLGYADIGPFGSRLNRTPHLDRLAAEGRKLTCFYAAPVCSPSRASLMTGCYPKRVGIPNVLFPGNAIGLHAEERSLPELLKGRGYATLCVGKWHLGDQPEFLPTRHGFDHYFGIPYSNDMGPAADGARSNLGEPPPDPNKAPKKKAQATKHPPIPLLRDEKVIERVRGPEQMTLVARYTEEAVRFIREHRDRPFFLYLAHTAVHFPLYPGKASQGKSKNGLYGDWVEEVDGSVGRVLEAVRDAGLAERTLVLFTSDNGGTARAVNAPLRGRKGSTLEGGMRVPTIAWWPGKIPAGTSTDEVATMMDVLPTLVRLAGGRVPADRGIDGRDVWPLLSGQPGAKTPHEYFAYFRGQNLEAVRSGPWKLELGSGKLYNLYSDIGESSDMAASQTEQVKRLRDLAARVAADLGDGKPGPGCREPGRVLNARPILDHDGTVRPENRGDKARYD